MSQMNTVSKVMVSISVHSAPNTICGYSLQPLIHYTLQSTVKFKENPIQNQNHYDVFIQLNILLNFLKMLNLCDQPWSHDNLLAKWQPTVQYRIVQLHFDKQKITNLKKAPQMFLNSTSYQNVCFLAMYSTEIDVESNFRQLLQCSASAFEQKATEYLSH